MDQDHLRRLWAKLSVEASDDSERAVRSVSPADVYASWNVGHGSDELLVGGVKDWLDDDAPGWNGMAFSLCSIRASQPASYLVLELLDRGLEVPFACFCADVIDALEDTALDARTVAFGGVVDVWNQFFLRGQDDTMPEHGQRGLYAELWWMRRQLVGGAAGNATVSSWMGPLRAFHDFDDAGHVVEVKSTIRKEPRKVTISNERQLADGGLQSLRLFVLTLDKQQNGESLPEMVAKLRDLLDGEQATRTLFNRKLVLARYRDDHAERYSSRYRARHEEIFRIGDGFPRIVNLADGLGDLSYTLQVSACQPFEEELKAAQWIED